MRQIKQEAFFTGIAVQGSPVRSNDGSFRDTNGRSSRVRGYFSALAEALGSGLVSALPASRARDLYRIYPSPPPDSRRLNHHAEGAGRVPRHREGPRGSRRFGAVLVLAVVVSVMAGWVQPAQAAQTSTPSNVMVTGGDQSLTVTWDWEDLTTGNVCPLTGDSGFEIQYRKSTSHWRGAHTVEAVPNDETSGAYELFSPQAREFTINASAAGPSGSGQVGVVLSSVEYEVRVQAYSVPCQTGTPASEWSNVAKGTPLAAGTPDKPTSLTATAGDTEVTLRWDNPLDSGIDKYQVRHKAGSSFTGTDVWTDISGSSATTTSHTVTGLTNDTQYAFQIRAVDGSANGPASDTVTATPATDVTPVLTGTIDDQELTQGALYTSADAFPAALGGNGAITYSVASLPAGITLNSDRKLTGTATAPLAKKQFTYKATDSDTSDPDSDTLTFDISVAPKKPADFGAAAGNGEVTLSWTAIPGVDDWQYKQDSTGSTGTWTDIPYSSASTARTTIKILTNGIIYSFKVRAVVGSGGTLVTGVESDDATATPTATAGPTVTITGPPKITTSPFNVTFAFSEVTSSFFAGDITVGNLAVSGFSGSGMTYSATMTPSAYGGIAPQIGSRMYVRVNAGVATNSSGVGNQASSLKNIRYGLRRSLTISGVPATTSNNYFTATFTFSKQIRHSEFTSTDVKVTNAIVSDFTRTSGSGNRGKVYTATITPTADGAFTVSVPQDAVKLNTTTSRELLDFGNTAASASGTYTCTGCPGVTSIERHDPATSPTDADTLTWRVTFDEDVKDVDAADFTVSGTSATLAVAAKDGTSKTVYDVTASGGDLAGLNATVTLGFANNQNITDTDTPTDNPLTNTTPTGANDNTFVVKNSTLTGTIADQALTQDTSYTSTDAFPAATGGTSPYTYSVASLPSGITLNDTSTDTNYRKLTGTATAPLAKTEFTYKATDSAATPSSDTLTFNISVAPKKPEGFTATVSETAATWATLSWTAIPGVSGWEFKQDSTGSPGSWTAIYNSDASTNSHTVGGLTYDTAYTFKVRAFVGDSSATPSTRVDGVESDDASFTPDKVPVLLNSEGNQHYVQGTAVDVTLPAATGGDGHPNYDYTLAPTPALPLGLTFNASTRKLTGTPSAPRPLMPQFSGVDPLTYTYTYKATEQLDPDGTPESSNNVYFTIDIKPKKPENFTAAAGDTEVTLAWTANPGLDYLSYKQGTTNSGVTTFGTWQSITSPRDNDDAGETNSHTVTGLTNGTTYTFKIHSGVGTEFAIWSADSDEQMATPSDDLSPALPTVADQLFVQGVAVDFTLPAATGGEPPPQDVAPYIYTLTPDVSGIGLTFTAATHKLTGTSSAPKAKVSYIYTATESSDSDGTTESASKTFTIGIKPQKPENFTAAAGDTQVTLSWTAIAGVSGWELKQDSGSWAAITGSSAATNSHTVTGLTNGTEYSFKVRAFVGTGDSRVDGVESATKSTTPAVVVDPTPVDPPPVDPTPADLTPALSGSIADQELTQGTAYTSAAAFPAATGGDGTISYSVANLPAGITLDGDRKLSGTATAPLAKTELTYKATDSDATDPDSATLTFSIGVMPKKPEGFTAAAGDTEVILSWTAIAGVSGWEMMQDSGGWTAITGSDDATDSHKVTGLANDAAYTFKVRAFVGTGDSRVNGVESDAGSATPTTTVNPAERRVVKNTLAAIARATLSSASGIIERRFSSSPGSGGFTLTGGVTELTPLETEGNPQADSFDQWDEDEESVVDSRDVDVENLLQSSAFELSSGNEVAAWTFWGRGDLAQFEGRPDGGSYDGSLRSGWLGFDARVNGNILAGLAVSRSSGDADYGFGDNGSGELETDLTSIHPYAQLVTGGGGSLRILGGVGWGEARNKASDRDMETRDLKMTMVSVGTHWPVLRIGNLNLSVKGDTGLVRLETDGDGKIGGIGGLSVDAWRMKGGVEVAHDGLRLSESGMTLSPLGSLSLRHDGGDGVTGTGLEVEGGVRLGNGGSRFGLEARGRWLTLHSEDGYGERGISLEARITPGAGGRGLSLSVGPQWGAAVEGEDALWRDEAFVRGSGSSENNAEASLAARAGYGFGVGGGVLTPFVEMDVSEGESERRRYGTGVELGLWNIHGRTVDAALAGERLEDSSLEPENRIGLDLRMSF